MEIPGQGRRKNQYEDSMKILLYSLVIVGIFIIVFLIGSALNLI
jgi:hypothetical protein